jgi:hypothetical protein
MTSHAALAPDAEADIRWREWQVRGAEGDRRRVATMRRLSVLVSIGLAVWLFVQLI